MKKTIYLFKISTILTFLITSCNNGDSKNTETENTVPKEIVCNCSDLKIGNTEKTKDKIVYQDSILFTGTCNKTDKYDSIIETSTFEKGFRKQTKTFRRILGAYYPASDMTFDIEGKNIDGYTRSFNELKNADGQETFYINSSEIWKEGKIITNYDIFINYNDMFDEKTYSFSVNYSYKDGKEIHNNREVGAPKCLTKAEFEEPYSVGNEYGGYGLSDGTRTAMGNKWEYSENDISKFNEIIDCFKTEFPNFDFFLKK